MASLRLFRIGAASRKCGIGQRTSRLSLVKLLLLVHMTRGDDHLVMAVPSRMARDVSTLALRVFLDGFGYAVERFGRVSIGRGQSSSEAKGLRVSLDALHDRGPTWNDSSCVISLRCIRALG